MLIALPIGLPAIFTAASESFNKRNINMSIDESFANYAPVAAREVPADDQPHDLQFTVDIARSSWVALRILHSSHTNPVFVTVGGKGVMLYAILGLIDPGDEHDPSIRSRVRSTVARATSVDAPESRLARCAHVGSRGSTRRGCRARAGYPQWHRLRSAPAHSGPSP